jgi:hypothetical protein
LVPPHCPYFATEQLPPPPPDEVVVAAGEDLEVEVAEVWRVVLTGFEVAPPPEPGVYRVCEIMSIFVNAS